MPNPRDELAPGTLNRLRKQAGLKKFCDPMVVEVYAETATENVPSRRVAEKAGFRHVGRRSTDADGIVDQWLISR